LKKQGCFWGLDFCAFSGVEKPERFGDWQQFGRDHENPMFVDEYAGPSTIFAGKPAKDSFI
jgi:hypothetical protein